MPDDVEGMPEVPEGVDPAMWREAWLGGLAYERLRASGWPRRRLLLADALVIDVDFDERDGLFTASTAVSNGSSWASSTLDGVRALVLGWAELHMIGTPVRFRYSDRVKLTMS